MCIHMRTARGETGMRTCQVFQDNSRVVPEGHGRSGLEPLRLPLRYDTIFENGSAIGTMCAVS